MDSLGRRVLRCKGVPIAYKEETAVLLLKPDPVLKCAVPVPQMQATRRAHAANDGLHIASPYHQHPKESRKKMDNRIYENIHGVGHKQNNDDQKAVRFYPCH